MAGKDAPAPLSLTEEVEVPQEATRVIVEASKKAFLANFILNNQMIDMIFIALNLNTNTL